MYGYPDSIPGFQEWNMQEQEQDLSIFLIVQVTSVFTSDW